MPLQLESVWLAGDVGVNAIDAVRRLTASYILRLEPVWLAGDVGMNAIDAVRRLTASYR